MKPLVESSATDHSQLLSLTAIGIDTLDRSERVKMLLTRVIERFSKFRFAGKQFSVAKRSPDLFKNFLLKHKMHRRMDMSLTFFE